MTEYRQSGSERRRRRRWRFGNASFDESQWALSVDGRAVQLEGKPLEILHELLLNAGEVVSKGELLDAVWPGVHVVEASLTTAVSKLRKALADDAGEIIETVPRIGYRLVAPVAVESLSGPLVARFAFKAGDPVPGRAQWRLMEALGDTGAEDVWRAAHAKTGERRVFKFADAPDRLKALKREATLARLMAAALGPDGPYVPLLEWNFEASPYFLESRDGGESLTGWASAAGGLAAIPIDRRLAAAKALAQAVAAVHGLGILHKDLKPANILIEDDGSGSFKLRLADFGSGRLLDGEALGPHGITDMGVGGARDGANDGRSGTLLYRAPELVGDAVPDAKSDIYALGLILFQLVVCDFDRALAPGWEGQVADPILRADIAAAAAGDPAERLASAQALAERLDQLEARRADATARAAEAQRIATLQQAEDRRVARRPWVLAAAAAATIGLIGTSAAAVVASRQRDEASRQQAIAEASYRFLADDMIGRVDPTRASAADETVTEAARRAGAEIDRRFADAPLIAARLNHAMARAFDQRSEWASARAAYAATDAAFGRAGLSNADEAVIARLQRISMEALSTQPGSLQVARARLAQEEGRLRANPPSPVALVWLDSARGMTALVGEDVPTARDAFRAAADRAESLPGLIDERQRLKLRQRAAFTELRLGNAAGAEAGLRPVAKRLAELQGADHPDTLLLGMNLAQLLLVQKRHAEAVEATAVLLPAMEQRFGPDHRITLQALAARQQALFGAERYPDAVAAGTRVWQAAAERDGPTAFLAIAGRIDVGNAQCRAGQTADGTANARAALAAARQAGPGADTALAQAVRAVLADCLALAGKYAEAASLLRGIDRARVSALVGDSNWGAHMDLTLAELALAAGDNTEAHARASAAAKVFADPATEPYQSRRATRLLAEVS